MENENSFELTKEHSSNIELHNENLAIIVGEPGVRQIVDNWDELDCNKLYNKDLAIIVGELDCNELYNEDSANIMNELAARQIFGS
ncbi:23485_t:CDS:2 [Racocetra persica]|uniref:23485_t:CDS:1 n=1 Tax=Racocetra persica TaxID=160502 RepID=A0ACA9LQZ1_9GLOM|nr:23485_t:CDS:2 [Racocetra persica]